jgi:cysteine desulfuration protein SufE
MSRDPAADIEEIQARKATLIRRLSMLPPGDERLLYILQLGRKYPAMDEALKSADRLLPGCISQLWIQTDHVEGGLVFQMDADAAISKGIAASVCGFYNGMCPAAILAVEPDFFEETGLSTLISPNRSNALSSLRKYIVAAARADT